MSTHKKNRNQQNQDDEDHPVDLTYCFQCGIILADEIKKVEYIGQYTVSNSKSAMSKMIGQQIDNKLKNQQELEKKFQELIMEKSSKIDLVEEEDIKKLNQKIAECALELKDSTNNICKTLAENPDIPKNLLKAKEDRDLIIKDLMEFQGDFINGKFEKYNQVIERIQRNEINIDQKRKREMELFKQLKTLNEKLTKEEAEFNKEQNEMNQTLISKKRLLAKTKNEEKTFEDYQKNYISALFKLHKSNFEDKETKLKKNIEDKRKEKERIADLNQYVRSYLVEQGEKYKKEKDVWNEITAKDVAKIEGISKDLSTHNTELRDTIASLTKKIKNYRDANNHLEEVAEELNYTNFYRIHTTDVVFPPINPNKIPEQQGAQPGQPGQPAQAPGQPGDAQNNVVPPVVNA